VTDDQQETAFRRHLAEAARDPHDLAGWHHARLIFADWLEERGKPEAWAARAGWSVVDVWSVQESWGGQSCQWVTTLWDVETAWPAALWDAFEFRADARCKSGLTPCPDLFYRLIDRPNGRPLLHFPPRTLEYPGANRNAKPCRGPDTVRMAWRFRTSSRDGELQVRRTGWPLAEGAHPLGLLALFAENHLGG
jgi:uncharacterized protein (TIGR02996 family)